MATQPTQQPQQKNPAGAGGDKPPQGATVGMGPRPGGMPGGPGGPPQSGGKPSEEGGAGGPSAAKPPVSGEGATGQRLPGPGEGPAKLDRPGEQGSKEAVSVSRTEKGEQSAGKGNLKIRLEDVDDKVIDHVLKAEDAQTQYPFRVRVGGVIYERSRTDDQGREVYTAART